MREKFTVALCGFNFVGCKFDGVFVSRITENSDTAIHWDLAINLLTLTRWFWFFFLTKGIVQLRPPSIKGMQIFLFGSGLWRHSLFQDFFYFLFSLPFPFFLYLLIFCFRFACFSTCVPSFPFFFSFSFPTLCPWCKPTSGLFVEKFHWGWLPFASCRSFLWIGIRPSVFGSVWVNLLACTRFDDATYPHLEAQDEAYIG